MKQHEEQHDNSRQSVYHREFLKFLVTLKEGVLTSKMVVIMSLTSILILLIIMTVMWLLNRIRFRNLLPILLSKILLQD